MQTFDPESARHISTFVNLWLESIADVGCVTPWNSASALWLRLFVRKIFFPTKPKQATSFNQTISNSTGRSKERQFKGIQIFDLDNISSAYNLIFQSDSLNQTLSSWTNITIWPTVSNETTSKGHLFLFPSTPRSTWNQSLRLIVMHVWYLLDKSEGLICILKFYWLLTVRG